jgi:hypothetical protein
VPTTKKRTPKRPVVHRETLFRLRCGDDQAFSDMSETPERIVSLGIRLWKSVLAFERQSARMCGDTPAPFVLWDQIDWLPFRRFMVEHADHLLELISEDGEVIQIAASFGMNWRSAERQPT